jgi:hypothetical protein
MNESKKHFFLPHPSPLLRLFVPCVFAATAAEFVEFKTLRSCLLVLRRRVITAFAFRALQHNVIARHKSPFEKLKLQN